MLRRRFYNLVRSSQDVANNSKKSTETRDMETFTLTFGKETPEFTDTGSSVQHLYKGQPCGSASQVAEFQDL